MLASRWVALAARVGLVSGYLIGGVTKLYRFHAAAAEQQHFGLHPARCGRRFAIAVELGGSALVLSGRCVWLGAGALGVLTAVAMVAASPFWTMHGHEQFVAFNTFFEHAGLVAGCVLVAVLAEGADRQPARHAR